MNLGLAGKTILVTGASGGIGNKTAEVLLNEGANVILHYNTNQAGLDNLLTENHQRQTLIHQANLSLAKEVESLFSAANSSFGRIDGLVNNAGIWPENDTPISEMTEEQWDRTMAVNLRSMFLCTKYFAQNLIKYPGDTASVVLIGSTAGVFGEAGHIDYASSKAALQGLMLSLKNEIIKWSKFGRVNTISPGWTNTRMATEGIADQKLTEKVFKTMPLRKIAQPIDIANTIVHLLSDVASGHVSGQNIVIAGGMEGRIIH
ncbi:MAG: SDR family NAD(P)-dependent oxidoreductase [Candidatus Kariarchaeaceae archaeon]|jgi:NAD(P)-dependent dehydrogenase (short-subunit alcohol dehydrogenase family)